MYALAVNGSPRKGGNTETLLKGVLAPLGSAGWETELLQIGTKTMRGCIACGKCWENRDSRCSFTDDGFNDIMDKIVKADALVFGSPTYFAGVRSEIKSVIDRAGYVGLANGGLLAGKIGAAVVAVRRGGATHVFDTINHMFLMSKMIVPGSTYWNIGFGLDKGDAAADEEGLANMDHLGRTIDWLGRAMQPSLESFPRV
ncbi:MAG: flavodoxin family protein [Desulfobacteraceae bacterium]